MHRRKKLNKTAARETGRKPHRSTSESNYSKVDKRENGKRSQKKSYIHMKMMRAGFLYWKQCERKDGDSCHQVHWTSLSMDQQQ